MSACAANPTIIDAPSHKGFGWAWMALCAALAIHVVDEASTDFLSVYNPAVLAIRSRVPLIPLPTFTFNLWLAGLIAAVIVLFSLSWFAFRGARLMALLSYPFAIMMTANGLGHIGSSVYMGKLMPGVYSAPLLIAGSIYLLKSVANYRKTKA